ncbi:MAG: sugar ABC transporter substrate-binding protein [Christensenellales bacterium]
MKRKSVSKVIIGLVLILTMVLLAACGADAPPSQTETPSEQASAPAADPSDAPAEGSEQLSIGAVLSSTYTEFWSAVALGVEEGARDLGVNVTVVAPASEADIASQTNMVEEMISRDIDALIVSPVESATMVAPLKAAIDKNIPVVVFDSDTAENRDVFVGISNKEAAASVSPVLSSVLGEGKKYVMIGGVQGHQADIGRCDGFKQAISESGGELLELQNGDWTADKAMTIMENFLSKYTEIDAVCCASDNTALGALRAVQATDRDIEVIGFDANESAVQEVIDGNMLATISQDAYNIGYTTVECAVKLANGEKVDEFVYVPTQLVTGENAKEFYDSMWGS